MMKEILLAGLLFVLPTALFASNNSIEDYGTNKAWIEKLQTIKKSKQGKFRIIQLGDSHTAADFFTDTLRQRLQLAYGDGGIGWVYPTKVSGQRLATVSYSGAEGWTVLTSRKDESSHFPMGGILALLPSGSSGSINARHLQKGVQNIQINAYASHSGQSLVVSDATHQMKNLPFNKIQGWQTLSLQAKLPVEIHATQEGVELGLINIENQQPGVVVSAMGINGAQFSDVNKWRTQWYDDLLLARPDLLILAYGTNEAFNNALDVARVEASWNQIIQQIKKRLPHTSILMVGAPESLVQNHGQCGVRSSMLDQVQQMQRRIAQRNQLMYWSWEDAMGGRCTMRNWSLQGLGRKDGVHFSAEGYREAANVLADQLIRISRTKVKTLARPSKSEPEIQRIIFPADATKQSSVMMAYVPDSNRLSKPVKKAIASQKKINNSTEKKNIVSRKAENTSKLSEGVNSKKTSAASTKKGTTTSAKKGTTTSAKKGTTTSAKKGTTTSAKKGTATSAKKGTTTSAKKGTTTSAKKL